MTIELHLAATVGADRRLNVQLPAGAPTGPVEVTIRSIGAAAVRPEPPGIAARAAARARLAAAGFLSDAYRPPAGARALAIEERIRAGTLPPGSRPSEALVDEERGAY